MTPFEELKQTLEKVKSCPDSDISLHWQRVCTLFLPMVRMEANSCATEYYQWAQQHLPHESLKFHYAEFLNAVNIFMKEDYEKALPKITEIRKTFEDVGDEDGVSISSLLTGVIYRSFGNYDLALKILIPPFEYFKSTGHYPIFLEGCCNSLANINFELRNYKESFSFFKTCYEATLKSGNEYFRIYALHGMGKVSMKLNQLDQARQYCTLALEDAEKNQDPLHICNSYAELANFYVEASNLEEAEALNKKALAIREQNKFIGAVATSCIKLGEIYIRQSRWDDALEILNKGLAIAEQLKVKPKMYQSHLLLSKVYKGKGELEKSLSHYEAFHDLHEKVLEEDNARKLSDARLIFESEQTKKENIIIKKQKEEIQNKNIELQETIDELTITRISRKAKALTLVVAIALFFVEDTILHFALHTIGERGYWISMIVKIVIIFSLSPINKAIEKSLVKKVILKRRN
jgi:tetratricopeptide (TPR) repeat protein